MEKHECSQHDGGPNNHTTWKHPWAVLAHSWTCVGQVGFCGRGVRTGYTEDHTFMVGKTGAANPVHESATAYSTLNREHHQEADHMANLGAEGGTHVIVVEGLEKLRELGKRHDDTGTEAKHECGSSGCGVLTETVHRGNWMCGFRGCERDRKMPCRWLLLPSACIMDRQHRLVQLELIDQDHSEGWTSA